MNVILCEAFYSGSHKQWADSYAKHSQNEITLLTVDDMGWRKCLRESAEQFVPQIQSIVSEGRGDIVILCSSMTNAAVLKANFPEVPLALFMHENQLGYPGSKLPSPFAAINWQSLRAVDQVLFNSEFHKQQLVELLPELGVTEDELAELEAKSEVVYVGIDPDLIGQPRTINETPLVLFNQRWEQDKRPDLFLEACVALVEQGIEFDLALCGEHYPGRYRITEALKDRIKFEGYLDRPAYLEVLSASDIVVSTSEHEYFGVAVAEAIAAGALPCLPYRLSYPELLPQHTEAFTYTESPEKTLKKILTDFEQHRSQASDRLTQHIAGFEWPKVAARYDKVLENLYMEFKA